MREAAILETVLFFAHSRSRSLDREGYAAVSTH
jgi:hypothetical protein